VTVATGERASAGEALRAARDRVHARAADAEAAQRRCFTIWGLCREARDLLGFSHRDSSRAVRVADLAYEDYRYAAGVADGLREARDAVWNLALQAEASA